MSIKQLLIPFIALLLFSCGEASRKELLPRNSGAKGEVAVVAPAEVWSTSVGDAIREEMRILMYGLPQDELLLNRVEIKEGGFKEMFQTHRNILKIEIHPNQPAKVQVRRDVYARQQLFIQVNVPSMNALPEVLSTRMKDILRLFHEAEIDRLIERNEDFGKDELNQEVKEHIGLNITMQDKFQVAVKDDDFIWLRLDQSKPLGGYQHSISQGLLIYRRPYQDTIQFSDNSLFAWKNAVNQRYVEGPQNSYMNISERFILPKSKRVVFLDQTAIEIRGLWRMEGYFMGGPFYALSFFNPNDGNQYMVEGYAYAPQFDKAPLIREIEAMVKSIRLDAENQNN